MTNIARKGERMAGSTAQVQAPAEAGDATGDLTRYEIQGVPFFAVQEIYVTAVSTGYGWSPAEDPYVVRIYQERPDKTVVCLAVYVSVENEDLSKFFNDGTYRIGVRLDKVKAALEGRIRAATDLLKAGGGEAIAHLKLGWRALEILPWKLVRLQRTVEKVKCLMEGGWSHFVLVSGWNAIDAEKEPIARLDLNTDFFNSYYPQGAFPVAGLGGTRQAGQAVQSTSRRDVTYVNCDCVVSSLCEESVREALETHQTKATSNISLPGVEVSFNRSMGILVNEDKGPLISWTPKTTWPLLPVLVQELSDLLGKYPEWPESEAARCIVLSQIARLGRLSGKLHKRGKKKESSQIDAGQADLVAPLIASHKGELRKILGELSNATKKTLDKVALLSRRAVGNLAAIQASRDAQSGDLTVETHETLGSAWTALVPDSMKRIKAIVNPLGQDLISEGLDVVDIITWLQYWGAADSGDYSALNDQCLKGFEELAGLTSWDEERCALLYLLHQALPSCHEPDKETWASLKKRNTSETEMELARQPRIGLNRRLRQLLYNHVKVFDGNVTPEMMLNHDLVEYVAELQDPSGRPDPRTFVDPGSDTRARARKDAHLLK